MILSKSKSPSSFFERLTQVWSVTEDMSVERKLVFTLKTENKCIYCAVCGNPGVAHVTKMVYNV